MQWRRIVQVAVLLGAVSGCYRAVNYPDPASPVYTGQHARTPPPQRQELRVVTFNIAFARQIDAALEVLRAEAALGNPDVLCLQEMDAPGVERIARELGLNYVYFPSALHPKHERDFGCAILSPWPLEEPRKIVLPASSRITGLQRALTVATLRQRDERLRVYSVHLPSPMGISNDARRRQVEMLLADASAAPDPVIVAGDFNSESVGEQFVQAGFAWPTRDAGLSTDFLGFGFSFDHIFSRGLHQVDAGIVADNRAASDHHPVWAVLTRP